MRLAFPNGEHDEVTVGKGTLTIGSSPGDNVRLEAAGVEPGHVVIIVDRRGITLNVDTAASQIAVNDRPVVEKAILRLGDKLEIGPVSLLLRADPEQVRAPPDGASPSDNPRRTTPKFHLRGISGYHQGRIIPLTGALSLGHDDDCDLVIPDDELAAKEARIEVSTGAVYLRSASGEEFEINGNRASAAVLDPGDQVRFGQHRFLLETPGFVPGKVYAVAASESQPSNTQVFASPVIENQAPARPQAASEVGFTTQASGRDAIVVAVCVLLSAAMLIWLFFLS